MEEEVKISELPDATDVNDDDLVMVVQDGFNKQVTFENFQKEKVSKTGDTLTGELNFNNKNDYAAIRKTRTINGTDYSVSISVGTNTSARMELYQGNNSLGMVEVRNDGVYNGKKNLKLAETAHMTWGTSFSFPLEGGHQAIIMGASSQLAMAWIAGDPPSLNFTRIAGNELNATYDGTNVTVTYGNGGSFTCGVFIV